MKERQSYNTNLASEFLTLAILHRLGFEAYITLGNKKTVDIDIKTKNGRKTIDVKGINKPTGFPMDNFDESMKLRNHFVIFVCYLNKIDKIEINPEMYIVPSRDIGTKLAIYRNPKGTRKGVRLKDLRSAAKRYISTLY